MFVYGDERVPALMVIPAGQPDAGTYRILTDHLGSVRRVVNVATGHVLQAIDYDAFGNILSDTNPGLQPFGFAGGLYDPDTGLLRFGARDYDPEIGQWTARDPILFRGGSTNLYEYAGNDPVNLVDPRGTVAVVVGGAAITVGGVVLAVTVAAVVVTAVVLGYLAYQHFTASDSIVTMGGGGRPRNNHEQNRQFNDAVRKLGEMIGRPLTKSERRDLHDACGHGDSGDVGYHDIVEIGLSLLGDEINSDE